MTPEDLNKAASERQAANMRATLGALNGEAIDLRTQLEVASMYIGTLEEEAKLAAAKLEAAEKQVEESGAEIERLTEINQSEQDRYAKLHEEYIKFVEMVNSDRREARNAARRKPRK